jgi:hypothetical protein
LESGLFFATRFLSQNGGELRNQPCPAVRHPADGRVYDIFVARRPVTGGPTTCPGSSHLSSTRRCAYYTCMLCFLQPARHWRIAIIMGYPQPSA